MRAVISSFAEKKVVLERLVRIVKAQVKGGARYEMFPRWAVTVPVGRATVVIANAMTYPYTV